MIIFCIKKSYKNFINSTHLYQNFSNKNFKNDFNFDPKYHFSTDYGYNDVFKLIYSLK